MAFSKMIIFLALLAVLSAIALASPVKKHHRTPAKDGHHHNLAGRKQVAKFGKLCAEKKALPSKKIYAGHEDIEPLLSASTLKACAG